MLDSNIPGLESSVAEKCISDILKYLSLNIKMSQTQLAPLYQEVVSLLLSSVLKTFSYSDFLTNKHRYSLDA